MVSGPVKVENNGTDGAPGAAGAAAKRGVGCELRPLVVIAIALAPLLVFWVSDYLLQRMGARFDQMPAYFGRFDPFKAEALRLDVVGAFFLFSAGAAGALLYFLYTLRVLRRSHAATLLALFVVSTVLVGLWLIPGGKSQADRFVGSGFVCTSLGYNEKTDFKALGWPVAEKEKDTGKPKTFEPKDARVGGKACDPAVLADLRWLIWMNKVSILLGLAALVLGSICCLAKPAADSVWTDEEKRAHYDSQSERLNTYLYLSAILLVTGLMFLAALLKWPAHALPSAESYEAQAKALTAFYGFSYTAILASFYVPVAMILSAEMVRVKPASGAAQAVPEAFKGPLQVFKIAAAIGSPTLVPLLGGLLGLG